MRRGTGPGTWRPKQSLSVSRHEAAAAPRKQYPRPKGRPAPLRCCGCRGQDTYLRPLVPVCLGAAWACQGCLRAAYDLVLAGEPLEGLQEPAGAAQERGEAGEASPAA